MKRWEIEYDDGDAVRRFEFEHEGTPTLKDAARALLRDLRDRDHVFPLVGRPTGAGESALQTLSAARITVLEPRPSHDPS